MCRVNDPSGLCYVGMSIHFRSGEFQALDMSIFLAKVMPKFSMNFGMICARQQAYRVPGVTGKRHSGKHRFLFYVISHFFHTFRIKQGDLIIGNMSNNEETGPSDQDAEEMDYEGEQEYLDYLTAKQQKSQGLQVGPDDGTDADIDTGDADVATEKKKQRIRKPNKLGIGRLVITKMAPGMLEPLELEEPHKCYGNQVGY